MHTFVAFVVQKCNFN